MADVKVGLQTGNNDLFLKLWFEVNQGDITFNSRDGKNIKYCPHNKAGEYRKWYGNAEYVVNWENNGKEIKKCNGSRPQNTMFYFRQGYSWSDVSSGALSIRFWKEGAIFDTCAPTLFAKQNGEYLFALVNSKIG